MVVDEVGLVSPAVAKRRLQGPGWYADVAGAERPDWMVTRRAAITGAGYGFSRLSIRGNGMVSRTWSNPAIHASVRSTPIPKPAWGTLP